MNNQTKLIIGGIIIAGVSFFAGAKYDQSKTTAVTTGGTSFTQNGQTRTGGVRGARTGGTFNGASGSIVSKDSTGITVKLRDGSGSKIIFVSPSTTYTKTTAGTTADLVIGKEVMVTGTPNPDGSINAQSIQLRPSFATSTPTQ